MPEILTDEQAAAIWSGQTVSIQGLEPSSTKTPEEIAAEKVAADKVIADKAAADEAAKTVKTVTEADLDKVLGNADPEDEEEDEADVTKPGAAQVASDATKKAGRKATDTVQLINKLIQEDVLFGYQDDKGGLAEIKTIDEAIQLIKDNLSERDKGSEEAWKDNYKKSLSPQVQAVLHYAEQGAQSATQLIDLLGAIKQVEEVSELDVKTPGGQEQIVRQTLKAKGFKDTYIDKQVNILKDLGGEKLKEEAEELYPELASMRSQQVKQEIEAQELRRKEAEDASKVYVSTIRSTLDKDVVGGLKLTREDKAKLFEATTQPKYTSLNGAPTNLFVKTLEDLQFGKNANYEQFMNIVQYVVDPKGFLEKLKTSVGNTIADETFRKLKTSKSTTSNTSQDDTGRTTGSSTGKRTISKSGFVNPYA